METNSKNSNNETHNTPSRGAPSEKETLLGSADHTSISDTSISSCTDRVCAVGGGRLEEGWRRRRSVRY
eukprot:11161873-Lingulodinium_polyedra.AAC.1